MYMANPASPAGDPVVYTTNIWVLSGTGTRTTLAGLADICLADIGELAAWLEATA